MKIEDFGYDSFFEASRNNLQLGDFSVARVVTELKGAYRVRNESGEYLAKVTGKQVFKALSREDYPAVGDWVAISTLDDEHAVIQGLLPRRTMIKRRHGDKNRAGERRDVQVIAANIDVAFVVESVDRDYNLNRFERYFAIARDGGVAPAIILNKIDLISPEELENRLRELKDRFPGVDMVLTSIVNDEGLDDLRGYLEPGKTYCFLGSSGVGKSSLINKLLGADSIRTGGISSYSGRGKHTTTARQMYFLQSGAIVIDNPGMREVGMTDASQGIDSFFNEVAALARACKYVNCTHTHEPGCAVIKAVESGSLDAGKYSNYVALRKEAEFYEMNDFERREKDRQFGKFIKTVKKELKNFGYED